MTEENQTSDDGDAPSRERDSDKHPKTIARLEQALADETRTSALLRGSLETLQQKTTEIEASLERRLDEANKRSERAEAKLVEQQVRLNALGSGREETMRILSETRDELARVKADRNHLQKRLAVLDGMQTETVALSEDGHEDAKILRILPTIEKLMASLSSIKEGYVEGREDRSSQSPDGDAELPPQDMISPDLIFPEESEDSRPRDAAARNCTRILVYLDANPPIKYPLYKDVITIGRSISADIQIDDDFLSRVHARIVSDEYRTIVEDVDSKNGIKVNSKLVERQALRHGDVIGLGKLRFTYIETPADQTD